MIGLAQHFHFGTKRHNPMEYRIKLTKDDNGTYLVTFPDFPEATTFGEDEDEARMRAIAAIETAIDGRITDREDIPSPIKQRGRQKTVRLPTLLVLKIELYRAMRAKGITKAQLARALHRHPPEIDRLLDVRHASRLDQIDAAFGAMGRHVDVKIYADNH